MRSIRLSLLTTVASAAIGIFASSMANAQAFKVEPQKPVFDDLPSPEFGTSKEKSFKPKDWLEIEASFKAQMAPEPPSKTAERILVKWYIAVENSNKRGTFLLLTKDVTHVNVPLDEEIYSSVYLSPASMRRITGTDRGGKRAVKAVGYEILINGEKVATESDGLPEGWWNKASEKISRTDTVPLLDKSETPFATMWWDRYAEILTESR